MRFLLASLIALLPLVATAEKIPATIDTFLQNHCFECHDEDSAKGDLDLTALDFDLSNPATFTTWQKVHDLVRDGEMPPKKKPRPSATDLTPFLTSLANPLTTSDQRRQQRDGRTPLRRLNRTEHEYTLRDLLHLPHLEVRAMLPPDGASHGFDNVSAALDLSYVQMRRYLDAADHALDAATQLAPPPPSTTSRFQALDEGRFQNMVSKKNEALQIGDAVGLLRQPNSAQAQWWFGKFKPPVDGLYRLRAKTFGFLCKDGQVAPPDRPHTASLYALFGTQSRRLTTFDVNPLGDPGVHEATVYLRRGDQIEIFFDSLDDRNKGKTPLAEYTAPGIAVEWIEAEGPLPDPGGHPSTAYRALYADLPIVPYQESSNLVRPPTPITVQGNGKRAKFEPDKRATLYRIDPGPDPLATARHLLLDFMSRAFHRPVPESEVDRYLALVREKLDAKLCFQEAMRPGFKAVLCSPDFIFLDEGNPNKPLDAHAIANRLSYFLWRSKPDAELLAAVQKNPADLDAQIERMLADPKSGRFVDDFTSQWLELRNFTETQPDEQLYPEFDTRLQQAMPAETQAFFRAMLDRNLPASNLVDSDFTFVNAPLAKHYGIPGIEGVALRETPLPEDSPRGGLITHASILKITANGTTTSPVIRGVWMLDRLLGQPAPPPPPGTPAIEPDIRGAETVRAQLAKHSSDTKCARCHVRIDPPGFALESFDPIGGFRTNYRSLGAGKPANTKVRDRKVAYKIGPPVDASGTAPNGHPFTDITEFRKILLADQRQLARNLAGRLLTFATAAPPTFADRPHIEKILDETKATHHGLRSLIKATVKSAPFHQK